MPVTSCGLRVINLPASIPAKAGIHWFSGCRATPGTRLQALGAPIRHDKIVKRQLTREVVAELATRNMELVTSAINKET